MTVIDTWFAVLIGYECMRSGFELSASQPTINEDPPIRLFVSMIMIAALGTAWHYAQ